MRSYITGSPRPSNCDIGASREGSQMLCNASRILCPSPFTIIEGQTIPQRYTSPQLQTRNTNAANSSVTNGLCASVPVLLRTSPGQYDEAHQHTSLSLQHCLCAAKGRGCAELIGYILVQNVRRRLIKYTGTSTVRNCASIQRARPSTYTFSRGNFEVRE